jgi:hypothetical protein
MPHAASLIDWVALFVLTAALIAAALSDAVTYLIPNRYAAVIVLAFFLHALGPARPPSHVGVVQSWCGSKYHDLMRNENVLAAIAGVLVLITIFMFAQALVLHDPHGGAAKQPQGAATCVPRCCRAAPPPTATPLTSAG